MYFVQMLDMACHRLWKVAGGRVWGSTPAAKEKRDNAIEKSRDREDFHLDCSLRESKLEWHVTLNEFGPGIAAAKTFLRESWSFWSGKQRPNAVARDSHVRLYCGGVYDNDGRSLFMQVHVVLLTGLRSPNALPPGRAVRGEWALTLGCVCSV